MMKKKAVSLLICGALTLSLVTPALAAPSDLDGHWAEDAMTWAVESGILSGKSGALAPQDTATRAETAQILMNFCQATGL